MNGAESLVRTLVAGGVDVCFANPGTSEMHFVAALDRVEGMRCVLALFEGVVTGAADGYFRMKGRPASTLLHLGPGLANGLANLHNAKKANSGIVNIVGQHATYHIGFNAPLTSDIEGLARPMSAWVRTSPDAKSVAKDGAAAIAAAKSAPPQIATLILPADTAWNEADGIAEVPAPSQRAGYSPEAVEDAAKVLRGAGSLLLITGTALTEQGLALAAQIAGKTGCKVMGQTYNPRMARGRGRFSIDRIPYVIEQALPILKDFRHIVLVEANDPVAFFAYPNKPSMLKPGGCEVHRLTSGGDNSVAALEALASALGAKPTDAKPQALVELAKPVGALTHASIAQALAMAIPENAIVVDESITTGRGFFPPTAAAAPHDWLQNMGGSIGFSTPVATGA
ncbi:acetolactate synthase large subunit, partial [Bradyrhizobium sp.]|uniref:acetolactate synthase large subunit n=1 Tax=Bradyrhizobium sp. TaxID=376 RepID=UPI003C1FCEE8